MELQNLTADDVLRYMAFYVDVMGPGGGGRQLGLWIRRHGKVKTLGKILEEILQRPSMEPWVLGEVLMVLYTVPEIRSYVPVEKLDRFSLDEDPGYKAWVKQLRQEIEPEVLNFEDIVERVHMQSGVPGEEVRKILKALFGIIQESLERGDRIVLKGFGSFGLSSASRRRGVLKKWKQKKPKTSFRFSPGKRLRELVTHPRP